ncbi:MAG: tRNA pseudouridine(13) synthase TruD [Candidatus Aenigmarchaeota archaeon]|nr:tRNA pseudouridine(13) synthase TruD [Candidatus Aenigmarchaeota archaeon]
MYKIKSVPQDFVVDEITDIEESKASSKLRWKEKMDLLRNKKKKPARKFTVFRMTKTDIDFFRAIEMLSEKTGIPKKEFGYAGTKDKKAVTSQMISIPEYHKENLGTMKIKGIRISDIFETDKPIKLGNLSGNKFRIIVRNIDSEERIRIEKNIEKIKKDGFLNLFGEQRFSKDNIEIGRLLVRKDFKKAAELIASSNNDVRHYLSRNNDDCIGAIEILPRMLSKMFVHAYQSYIWNMTAGQIKKDCMIPIIGSKTKLENYPDSRKIIEKIMKKEGILLSDFVIKDIMPLSTRGEERKSMIKPEKFTHTFKEDGMNKGQLKLILSFVLPKGSYATVLIDFIMKI